MVRVAVAFGLVVLGPALRAADAADDPRQAQVVYGQGMKLFLGSEYGKALELFERAYGLHPDPDYLPAIGRAHHKLGRLDVACSYYQRYLVARPSGDNVVGVRRYLEELQPSYDCSGTSKPVAQGELVIVGGPAGTRVSIEGKLVGVTPLGALAVPVGERTVHLAPPDRPAREVKVTIRVATTTTLEVTDVFPVITRGTLRITGTGAADRVLVDGRPVASVAAPIELDAGTHVIEATPLEGAPFRAEVHVAPGVETAVAVTFATVALERGIGPWPWVVGGVGAGAALTGLVFTLVANRQQSEAEEKLDTTLHQSALDNDTVAYALYGVGGALVVGGVTWGLIARYRADGGPRTSSWWIVPSGGRSHIAAVLTLEL